ncbi:unnamed protein product [Owenia fusiformis]|uniref:Hexosyltransferase n=1 Tax=Owenia fusiformis TaxID=6347 RepID=A0A8S4PV12_OWEFU|nr:unnamed protein product [Owenia fusiformis]
MHCRKYGSKRYIGSTMFVGVVLGLALGSWLRTRGNVKMCISNPMRMDTGLLQHQVSTEPTLTYEKPKDNMIFVGVMTAQKYLDSRAVAANQTWAKTIPGKVLFFSRSGSASNYDIPVVSLPGVDDTYPPQKKSFLMLKYMHDHFIDKYDWFMRADDDVYIKGEKLSKFLYSINSSKPQFIGQAGLGTKEEFGTLSLDQNENFCMGGTGIVMSRETLKRIVPHIKYCLKNLYTTHEDVEIGRCVKKFAGVTCTWAFEMQHLFYQNHIDPNGSFSKNLNSKDTHRALTMHPVKQPQQQYRIHTFFQDAHTLELRHKRLLHKREIEVMNKNIIRKGYHTDDRYGMPPSLMKYRATNQHDILPWEFLSKAVYSDRDVNPKRGLEAPLKNGLEGIMMQVMQMINKNARQRGRIIDFKEILYGYRRVNPLYGADYVLDLLLVYRKHKGRKMTVPVRRHAYLQQTFSEIEFTEDVSSPNPVSPIVPLDNIAQGPQPNLLQIFQNKVNYLYTGTRDSEDLNAGSSYTPTPETIHFILPLSGRLHTFKRFLSIFEKVCLQHGERVSLAVMLFESEDTESILQEVKTLKMKYQGYDLRVVGSRDSFSRGVALQQGSALYDKNSLLFFIDVDMTFNQENLNRIRLNTIQFKQVYYPIVFSQYDPADVCPKVEDCEMRHNPFIYGENIGYWRQFGFGIVSLYKSDLDNAGGLDMTIQGWGKEDVDLYGKFLKSNLTIFRAVDNDLVHIFHPIICDPNLEPAQYQMCLGSKASSYGSFDRLSKTVLNNEAILHKNEKKLEQKETGNLIQN